MTSILSFTIAVLLTGYKSSPKPGISKINWPKYPPAAHTLLFEAPACRQRQVLASKLYAVGSCRLDFGIKLTAMVEQSLAGVTTGHWSLAFVSFFRKKASNYLVVR
jgi:hypothetical protein